MADPSWSKHVADVLRRNDIQFFATVPDYIVSQVLEHLWADPACTVVTATREEEALGILSGAWLGGRRGALLMQNSGLGNCINTLALQVCARFPLLMVVTMRGDWAEFNQWQTPMGQATEPALRLMGVLTWRADDPEEVKPLLRGAATMAFEGDAACAVLLGQRLIGEKEWVR